MEAAHIVSVMSMGTSTHSLLFPVPFVSPGQGAAGFRSCKFEVAEL